MKCNKCSYDIPDSTDDHYNMAHTEIRCPECDHWQDVERESVPRCPDCGQHFGGFSSIGHYCHGCDRHYPWNGDYNKVPTKPVVRSTWSVKAPRNRWLPKSLADALKREGLTEIPSLEWLQGFKAGVPDGENDTHREIIEMLQVLNQGYDIVVENV